MKTAAPTPLSPSDTHNRKDAVWELMRNLISGEASAETVLELYYWSRDPEMLRILRAVIELPPSSRRTIATFLAANQPRNITAEQQSAPPRLILSA